MPADLSTHTSNRQLLSPSWCHTLCHSGSGWLWYSLAGSFLLVRSRSCFRWHQSCHSLCSWYWIHLLPCCIRLRLPHLHCKYTRFHLRHTYQDLWNCNSSHRLRSLSWYHTLHRSVSGWLWCFPVMLFLPVHSMSCFRWQKPFFSYLLL